MNTYARIFANDRLKKYLSEVVITIQKESEALIDEILDEIKGEDEKTNNIVAYIIKACCEIYEIEESALKKPKANDIECECRDMATVLIQKNTDLQRRDIIRLFKKKTVHYPTLAMSRHKQKDAKIKHEKQYIEKYDIVSKQVKEYVKTNFQNTQTDR